VVALFDGSRVGDMGWHYWDTYILDFRVCCVACG